MKHIKLYEDFINNKSIDESVNEGIYCIYMNSDPDEPNKINYEEYFGEGNKAQMIKEAKILAKSGTNQYGDPIKIAVVHEDYIDDVAWTNESVMNENESVVTEAKDMTFADYLKILDAKFEDAMAAVKGENGSDAEITPTRGDILQNFTLFRNYVSSLTKKYKGDKTKLRFLTEKVREYESVIDESVINENESKDLQKIRKLAKKYGYVEVKDPESYGKSYLGDEPDISYTAIFIDPEDKNKDTYVSLWTDTEEESPEFGYLQVSWYYWGGPSGNDSIDYWTIDSTWKKMTNGEFI
jgi:hypothetical protein